jgi:hypothetical protein
MTTDRDDIASLLERVKAAKRKDRELDALIEVQARRFEAYAVGLTDDTRAKWRAAPNGLVSDPDAMYYAPIFTASTDAAVELVERLYPGEGIVLETHGINRAGIGQSGKHPATGATAPMAILASLLTSLKENHP